MTVLLYVICMDNFEIDLMMMMIRMIMQEEEAKLVYGMLFSLKSFVNKLSPTDMKQGFLSYKALGSNHPTLSKFSQFGFGRDFHNERKDRSCSKPWTANYDYRFFFSFECSIF